MTDLNLPVDHPTPPAPEGADAPLTGLRVVELSSERTEYAGRLLAQMGADVIVVEPGDGGESRTHEPHLNGVAGPERSLHWWTYNAAKRSVIADLGTADGVEFFRSLVESADIVLEGRTPGELEEYGIGESDLREVGGPLIWITITPFGRDDPRSAEASIDLTVLAGGGPVWSCGYDDHTLPPVRGGGNQGHQIGGHFAVMSALVAVLARDAGAPGQFIDVNLHAAANVTTEFASYGWLAAGETVMRQTGRHAGSNPSQPTQFATADGRHINSGVPPRTGPEFASLVQWLEDEGLADDFAEIGLLRLGTDYEKITLAQLQEDPLAGEIFGAGREALSFLAANLTAYEYFIGNQTRGLAAGIVYSPEEVLEDPHMIERGFPIEVFHEELNRTVTYPGAPIRFVGSPCVPLTRAPHLGEHTSELLAELATRPDADAG